MATYAVKRLGVGYSGHPVETPSLGTVFSVELLDDADKALLILHFKDEVLANECARGFLEALSTVSSGLIGITSPQV
jgi:hypothetical protein